MASSVWVAKWTDALEAHCWSGGTRAIALPLGRPKSALLPPRLPRPRPSVALVRRESSAADEAIQQYGAVEVGGGREADTTLPEPVVCSVSGCRPSRSAAKAVRESAWAVGESMSCTVAPVRHRPGRCRVSAARTTMRLPDRQWAGGSCGQHRHLVHGWRALARAGVQKDAGGSRTVGRVPVCWFAALPDRVDSIRDRACGIGPGVVVGHDQAHPPTGSLRSSP